MTEGTGANVSGAVAPATAHRGGAAMRLPFWATLA
jgi:hypothetical protein